MRLTILTAAVAIGSVAVLVPASSRAADDPAVTAVSMARQAKRWPMLGAMVDVGVPDGLIASVVFRPWKWVRVHGGGGSNTVSTGWRVGGALIPFGSGPSLSVEYGSYGAGDANGLVRSMTGGDFSSTPLLSKLAYDYANAHVGLEFGGKCFTFFIHGGVSRVWANLGLDGAMVADTGSETTVRVTSDPKVKAFGSSLKIGMILLLL